MAMTAGGRIDTVARRGARISGPPDTSADDGVVLRYRVDRGAAA
jgi:hypothetical protein